MVYYFLGSQLRLVLFLKLGDYFIRWKILLLIWSIFVLIVMTIRNINRRLFSCIKYFQKYFVIAKRSRQALCLFWKHLEALGKTISLVNILAFFCSNLKFTKSLHPSYFASFWCCLSSRLYKLAFLRSK